MRLQYYSKRRHLPLREIKMLAKLAMPEIISDDVIELHARNNHRYDKDLWLEIDKNRLFLRQYLLWVDKTNSVDDCASVTKMFAERWQNGEAFAYSIVLKSSGKAIGSIDIHKVCYDNFSAEIGYWLAKEHNCHGYMSRAVQLIENKAFSAGLNRLVIAVQKENLPSARVAEHNRYVYEGTLKQALYKYGAFYDERIYAKLNKA